MNRLLMLLFALLLTGCPTPSTPGGAVVPDDDDDATADDDDATADDDDVADDDDATAADDDDATTDDDDATDVDGEDDDSGDDDDSAETCAPQDLIDPTCTVTSMRELNIAGEMLCPVGAYEVSNATDWAALLTACGVGGDPLPGHDWDAESVVGFVDAGSGCDATAAILWAAMCDGRVHLGEAFVACGDCAAVPSAGAWAAIPPDGLPLMSRVRCVPDSMACDGGL